jgi:hypothetical protein
MKTAVIVVLIVAFIVWYGVALERATRPTFTDTVVLLDGKVFTGNVHTYWNGYVEISQRDGAAVSFPRSVVFSISWGPHGRTR